MTDCLCYLKGDKKIKFTSLDLFMPRGQTMCTKITIEDIVYDKKTYHQRRCYI